ncbi:hypothetical protein TSIB_0823 [Thermococcus sibiricus MM 739]|uniref:Uncharacterized protein n=1 Tax=Thermococcus sibiricus (strain DSM 12597 / MM 739) TaxID=604354 RepID=C6A2N9_THESM|nr:hypothetical protein TSIB_0823 [Thermococcus sibiricus MM 739]
MKIKKCIDSLYFQLTSPLGVSTSSWVLEFRSQVILQAKIVKTKEHYYALY